MKLWRIIGMDFDNPDQLLIRLFAFISYWRQIGNTMRHYTSYLLTSKNPIIQLGGEYFAMSSQSLGFP
jgi:hypothetical protein